jgi:uncharacterized ferritin-like protein (DUF455 family)
MEFFTELNAIRLESNWEKKQARLTALSFGATTGKIVFDHDGIIEPLIEPSFAPIVRIVHGSQVERRRNLDTPEGRRIFIHALAHIEYSAIDLALDSTYRFRHLPPQYYEDFLRVACDEARHFGLLSGLLAELNSFYGQFSVHTGIHDATVRSSGSLRQRMAATHRHLEANGLDAHPELARKFDRFSDPQAKQIRDVLDVIYKDEIGHVHAGDFWFRYACGVDGVTSEVFMDDVAEAIPGTRPVRQNMNHPARIQAGFTAEELLKLSPELPAQPPPV